jgi:hypothetical protein
VKDAAHAARPASDRGAWIIAGTLCVLLVGGIAYQVSSSAPQPRAPDMANAGASGPEGPVGPAPDISQMSPRERFDRLYDRVMRAAGRGDSIEVRSFTPMALGAYQQLDSLNVDARYHAAMLHAGLGQFTAALALADTILAESSGHLFGYLIRGEVAERLGDSRLRAQTQRDFLARYKAEMAAKRVEYLEHEPALSEFKRNAETQKNVNGKR